MVTASELLVSMQELALLVQVVLSCLRALQTVLHSTKPHNLFKTHSTGSWMLARLCSMQNHLKGVQTGQDSFYTQSHHSKTRSTGSRMLAMPCCMQNHFKVCERNRAHSKRHRSLDLSQMQLVGDIGVLLYILAKPLMPAKHAI